jgi:hypothetical protein
MLNAHVREQRQKTAAQFKSKFRVPPSNYLDNDIFYLCYKLFSLVRLLIYHFRHSIRREGEQVRKKIR